MSTLSLSLFWPSNAVHSRSHKNKERIVNTPIPDDRSLIEAVKEGDKQAFSVLTKKWYKPIYRYAHGLLRDEHLAAEATQDVFIQAYRAIAKFEHRAKFSTWLYHCGPW